MGKAIRALLAAAVIPLTLTGCKTASPTIPYVAPADGNTARLLFRAQTAPGMLYGVYAFDDPVVCSQPLLIGRGNAAAAPSTAALRAGPLATLEYVGVDPSRRACQMVLSFYPERGRTYLLATSQDANGCAMRLVDATDGENLKGVFGFRRTMQAGGRCTPVPAGKGSLIEAKNGFGGQPAPETSSSTRGLEDLRELLPKE